MNYSQIAIGLFVCSLAFFVVYLILIVYFKSLTLSGQDVKFRNSYPYEIYSRLSIPNRILLYGSLFLNGALGALGLFFSFLSFDSSYSFIIGIVYSISFLCLVASNVLPLNFYKSHLLTSLCGILGFSFASILSCFITVIPGALGTDQTFFLPICIIVGVLGFLVFLSCFNPKLLSWAKMDKAEENGKTIYLKPKVNYLAIYEWLVYIFYNIVSLIIFISLFF